MLLLLPPSETKRDGGADDSQLDLAQLGFSALTPQRRATLAALARLSRGVGDSMAALGLGPTQRAEIERNREVRRSAVMPAIDRYTGVLYDGLDAASLTPDELSFAGRHVAIHSALFGLLRSDDPIPAYRLSHDSRLPGLALRSHWRAVVTAQLASRPGLVLDLRSESYASLGPAPEGSWYVRVVTENPDGRRVALSHFNKKAKGEFVRAVLSSGVEHDTIDSIIEWALVSGIRLEKRGTGELDLIQ